MKKLISLLLAILLTASCALAEEPALPAYRYAGDEPYLAEICDWLIETEAGYYSTGDVAIPSPAIVHADDSNPQDILVWGIFELNWYKLLNTTLFSVSGGSRPGLLHLQQTDDGYAIVEFDGVGDGTDYAKDIDRIFGMRPGLKQKLEAAVETREANQLQFVSDYVNANQLNITQMQDYGWPPVALINAPETTEADQIIHLVSPLGYSIDYDLREFCYHPFDENTDGLSGVGDLSGISILMQKLDQSTEEAIADLEKDMAQPVRESVALGADNLPAIFLHDAATAEDVHEYAYAIDLNGTCLLIQTSNTYYAFADAPVVSGADEAIENALATLKIVE